MDYEQALTSLNSFTNYEHNRDPSSMGSLNLDRMRQLCSGLGNPERCFRSVLVAGTNGKGSICAMLYSMLKETKLRVGLYTSPHLENLRERIRVYVHNAKHSKSSSADDRISESEFASVFEQLVPVIEKMRSSSSGNDGLPTYFEILTAIAFIHFRNCTIDIAVLEVGLGGRLDATNVVEQSVSVISPIDMDHAEVLGRELAKIAHEKAGIIKPNQIVISSPQQELVTEVLRQACEKHGAPFFISGHDITASVEEHGLNGLCVSLTGLRGIYESIKIPLVGRHQSQNAAVAISALEALSGMGAPHSVVERGLGGLKWPGRFEVINERPLVVLDGAHNAHAMKALRHALKEVCPELKVHLLIGLSSDKNVEDIGRSLEDLAASATCTKSSHPRSMDPTELAKRLSPFCSDVHVITDMTDAYTYAFNVTPQDGVMVVTGSLFLVGELKNALRQSNVQANHATAAV